MRVIVVGGGVVGASTAYHLTRDGVATVMVAGRHDGQATAAGAGIVAPWAGEGAEPWHPLARGAAEHYPWLIERLAAEKAGPTGYAPVGGLSVSTDTAETGAMADMVAGVRDTSAMVGVGEVAHLPPGEPARRFPVLREDFAGVWVGGNARVDGRLLRDALLRAADARGLRRCPGTAELVVRAGRIDGVRVAGTELTADAVVVAAGAWTNEVLAPIGARVPVEPQRGQILHLRLPGHDVGSWPTVRAQNGTYYLLAFPEARVVVGTTRETGSGFDYRVTAAGLRYLLDSALEVAPGLEEASVVETRVGFRPLSSDGLPLVGPLTSSPEVVVATGLGPVGLTYGPYVGALAARVATGVPPEIDLSDYAPDRGGAR